MEEQQQQEELHAAYEGEQQQQQGTKRKADDEAVVLEKAPVINREALKAKAQPEYEYVYPPSVSAPTVPYYGSSSSTSQLPTSSVHP